MAQYNTNSQSRRVSSKVGYLPSLDGWRALAILFVFLNHDQPWTLFGLSDEPVRPYGGWGVYLFFAISGFLICTRVLEEEVATGRFHLRSFYIRRIFRIQPAALVYLATVGLLNLIGVLHDRWSGWIGALLLYTNFLSHASSGAPAGFFTGHFWTLAAEEHFYLVLSLLLFLFRRHRIAIFATLLAGILLAQQFAVHRHWFSPELSGRRTYWIIQYLLFPSLVALLLRVPRLQTLCRRYLQPWVAFTGTIAVMLLWGTRSQGWHHAARVFTQPLLVARTVLFSFTFWIIATTFHPSSWTTRLLELAPLRFLGRLSYSLYLWHVLFFIPVAPETGVTSPALLFCAQRPLRYLFTFAAALASYYLVERPLIRKGHRLAPPATAGHSDLLPKVTLPASPSGEALPPRTA